MKDNCRSLSQENQKNQKNQKTASFLLRVILLMLMPAFAFSEPMNLSKVKENLMQYHDSGDYDREFMSVVKEATSYLQFRVTQNARLAHPKKLAVVFDIDETSLSNYADMRHLNFGGTDEDVRRLKEQAHDAPLKPMLALYHCAERHDVAVFFITSRPPEVIESTKENLKKAGYFKWDGLYFRPKNYGRTSVATFKVADRKKIVDKGYDIILNLGDQYADIEGGYADMSFKLPNPFYKTS